MKTKYYIEDIDDPRVVWKNENGVITISLNMEDNWTPSYAAPSSLELSTGIRQITKAEARSLFPLAFPSNGTTKTKNDNKTSI